MNSFELDRVRRRIEQLGLKKQYLAKQWDLSPSRLSQYLSGKFAVPVEIESKMKKTLGL